MEAESGAKIAIRGKGSVKEGKGRSDAAHSSNQEEDLHCLIMAATEEKSRHLALIKFPGMPKGSRQAPGAAVDGEALRAQDLVFHMDPPL